MVVEHTPIEGVTLIKPQVWRDSRGYFVETWQHKRYEEAETRLPFVQGNHSVSRLGALRGVQFPKKCPHGKLVSASLRSVFDVAVDARRNSPTVGQWFGVELTQENQWQLWIAPGLAHAFFVANDVAHFHYKWTDYYCADDDGGTRWNDPDLAITWPDIPPILSEKDAGLPLFHEAN